MHGCRYTKDTLSRPASSLGRIPVESQLVPRAGSASVRANFGLLLIAAQGGIGHGVFKRGCLSQTTSLGTRAHCTAIPRGASGGSTRQPPAQSRHVPPVRGGMNDFFERYGNTHPRHRIRGGISQESGSVTRLVGSKGWLVRPVTRPHWRCGASRVRRRLVRLDGPLHAWLGCRRPAQM